MVYYPDGMPDELRYAEEREEEEDYGEGLRPVEWQRAVVWVVAVVLLIAVPLALVVSI
ncbi:hypothetical protein NBM05_06310 [Rothia sp. AR01]|uniref:Uncharacterized protein n=1 Tax=Rothia santali TaxID=2949643 RepID=A0A9X2KL15_9MICC|nr:hypothetical protein [Rothia santali]MCP3425636.1 hypothetical protein [Rothia santali]